MKALLFLNGEAPKTFPKLSDYNLIACSDGAFHYLKQKKFPIHKLDLIAGDFDSHSGNDDIIYQNKFIHTPDQNKTDFNKTLEILQQKGITKIDIFGGSGGEMDHFLGNLCAAFRFHNELDITFFDEFGKHFFIPKNMVLHNVLGKMISLYPFPSAKNIITNGLNWELSNENLDITTRIGTRNFAIKDSISIKYSEGDLIVFIGAEVNIYKHNQMP